MFQCEGGIDSYVNSLSEDSQSCWPGSSAVGARLSLKNSCGVHREGTICGLVLKAEGEEDASSARVVTMPWGTCSGC